MRICGSTLVLAWALLTFTASCDRPSTSEPANPNSTQTPATAHPLRVLVVDDVPLGKAIAREWKARTEQELAIRDVTGEQLLAARRLPGDVVIFPPGQVGELVERGLIAPLDEESLGSNDFDRRDIFEQIRLREMVWGNRSVAVPLGSPQLLLVYREEVFSKHDLEPPRTWREYQAVCDKLASLPQEDGVNVSPTLEPLAPGWAGQTLLARGAAYATHRDQISPLFEYETMQPLIDSPPFERALNELVAASRHFPSGARVTPAEAVELVCAGKAAMALGWIPSAPARQAPCQASILVTLAPGSDEAYNFPQKSWNARGENESWHVPLLCVSGRMGAVGSSAASPRVAQSFLQWLASSETSAAVCPNSAATTLFRQSHVLGAERWVADSQAAKGYAQTLAQSQSLPRHMSLRLPGRDRYLKALDDAVLLAVDGVKTPAQVLTDAAAAWDKITDEIGRSAQKQANRRELGTLALP